MTAPAPAPYSFGFSEREEEAFAQGDCWLLAEALHELFGYELVVECSSYSHRALLEGREEEFFWGHISCRTGEGLRFDIRGVEQEPLNSYCEKWEADTALALKLIARARSEGAEADYPWADAHRYARLVHERLLAAR